MKPHPEKDNSVRLQKVLAATGVGSRRQCETYIQQGLVRVNGEVVTRLGTCVDPGKDRITFNRRRVAIQQSKWKTIALYKPRGVVCTTVKTEGRNVRSLLPAHYQDLVPVGRLDKKSEGLLFLSNDGTFINHLTHPSFGKAKIYHVVVAGVVNDAVLELLRSRMMIDGVRIQPALVRILRPGQTPGRLVLEFTLQEGRNRQIRRMCEKAKLTVHRLKRVSIAGYEVKGLKPGTWRELSAAEVLALQT